MCVHTVLFRSAFRDWVAEETAYPGEVAEAALAHAIPNKGEAAQARRHGPAVLDALAGIGMARRLKDGWYAA